MTFRCWVRDLQAVSLILLLVAAAASAMVIKDEDSAEVSTDADVDATSTETSPEASSEPPTPTGTELLKKIGWACGLIKPVSNVSLETVLGRWYVLEIMSPNVDKEKEKEKRRDACAGVDFWRWDIEENNLMPEVVPPPAVGPEHLVMRGFNRHVNEHHTSSYRVDTTTVVQGSGGAIWDQPVRSVSACTVTMGASVAVVDFTPDARFMTVTTCVRPTASEWTSVLGRDPASSALPREELHQRLEAAGLRYVDSARLQNNTECVYP
ncbi:uncharacterized protein LOC126425050 isoform X1 [Schistocerca serialis cubense]|uniref:uncharacterized protein LOC126425050 isoform X1 n=1 Tax=Schistocerca serialis cubense TaxID=2023355 RepID=UPI00214E24E9|nr:uncharacterized protein LOC126425050 isoform X1 [Schistocerca serialis cubense]